MIETITFIKSSFTEEIQESRNDLSRHLNESGRKLCEKVMHSFEYINLCFDCTISSCSFKSMETALNLLGGSVNFKELEELYMEPSSQNPFQEMITEVSENPNKGNYLGFYQNGSKEVQQALENYKKESTKAIIKVITRSDKKVENVLIIQDSILLIATAIGLLESMNVAGANCLLNIKNPKPCQGFIISNLNSERKKFKIRYINEKEGIITIDNTQLNIMS